MFSRIGLFLFVAIPLALAVPANAQSSRSGWGSTPYHDASGTGVTFRVWAPNATSVTVPGTFNNWSTSASKLVQEQTNGALDGIWSADVAAATNGSQYKYFLNGNLYKHDPRSRWVVAAGTGSGANDIIYDPTAFNWGNDNLTPPSQNDLFIYEIHVGTFYTNGANPFVGATTKLNYLQSLGVNAVELMPVMEFGNSGTSWGYDPSQLFAVDNHQYGGPDGLKTFVKACHAHGIAVLLDVVHNHYGPSLLDMWNFDGWAGTNSLGGGGIYFYQSNTNLQITPWGSTRPNCSSNQVCNFMEDDMNLWLSEYHVDGFRWDTPDTIMHGNDGTYIPAAGNLLTSINAMIHTNYPGKISMAEDVYESKGFDSAWDTTYPGYFTPLLTNAVDANRNMSSVQYAVANAVRYSHPADSNRVVFLESHDVVGDLNSGSRLVTAIDPVTPNSYRARKLSTLGAAFTFTAPGIPLLFQGQEMLENQAFDSARQVDWSKTITYASIVRFYSDLVGARRNLKGYTSGLEGDLCSVYWVDNNKKIVAFNRWKSSAPKENVVVIGNFANTTNSNYSITFPSAGQWYVHLNSDSTNYGADFGNAGSTVVTASGSPTGNIAIGPYSVLVLSQTPDAPPQLSVALTNGVVTISWPVPYYGWNLEASPSLTGNSVWAPVPATAYQTNATSVFVNAAPTGTNVFYRLQFPLP